MKIASHPSDTTTIIFDLGKVIVDFDHMSVCERLAIRCDHTPEAIYEQIFTSGLESRFDCGLISPEVFYRQAVQRLSLDMPRDTFQEIWNTIFSLQEGIEALITRLGAYRLVCLSNTNPWHFEHCRALFPVLERFDVFALSYQVGVRKPHPLIFREALQRAGAQPHQCLFIDDVAEFVDAARTCGIDGIVFLSVPRTVQELTRRGILT